MGSNNAPHIMTLVNSIIGVSILAMPFCYKQCGIVLASLILVFSNLMTRLSCHYLLKSAIMTRRRTFELLAFHVFGNSGKTAVELSIILLMIGTCIAFFVVMGDLGPSIIGSLLEMEHFVPLRPAVLIGLAIFVVLPLGLLRNIDSLSSICTASFLFYLFLVFKVFVESTNNLFDSSWIEEVEYWRPAGLLQCLPIFSMALSCQTQLLEIFDSVANGTLDRMNSIVKSAVNLCTALYVGVGFFGYIAYYKRTLSGNLLMDFSESHFSEFIKLGFVLSVAVTFPMVIFPCRASLHSMLFRKVHVPHYELVTGGGNYIPEAQFKCITLFIITSSLIIGLLAPNIEVVLGLLGSTIGVVICILCPPVLFIWISSKATTEKVLAQMMCAIGIFIMVMGTYANMYLTENVTKAEPQLWKTLDSLQMPIDAALKPPEPPKIINPHKQGINEEKKLDFIAPVNVENKIPEADVKRNDIIGGDKRVEPPIPMAPEKKDNAPAEVIQELGKVPVIPAKIEGAPIEVRNEENKRVEPPVPVAPEAVKAAAEVEAKQHAQEIIKSENVVVKDEIKNLGQIRDNVSPSIIKQSQTSTGRKSRKEQKAGPKKNLEPNVENVAKRSKSEMLRENLPAQNDGKMMPQDAINAKKPDRSNDLPKDAQDKPPLPILMNAKSAVEKAGENVVQREILENVEREKRDLYYVNETLLNGAKNAKMVKEELVGAGDKENSFVETVAKTANDKERCEKEGASSNNGGTDSKIKMNAIENAVSDQKETKENEKQDAPLAAKADQQSANLYDTQNTEAIKESKRDEIAKLDDKHADEVLPNSAPKKADENEQKNSIILAPAKLSDPAVLLQDSLPADRKLEPIPSNPLKLMTRDLKTIDKPPDNRKK